MALAFNRLPISAALTASGQSSTVTLTTGYRKSFYLAHANGTGTITAGGTCRVQARPTGSSQWCELASLAFGTTASAVETRVVPLPDDAAEARLDYTLPTGGSGHSLDGEVGLVTAY